MTPDSISYEELGYPQAAVPVGEHRYAHATKAGVEQVASMRRRSKKRPVSQSDRSRMGDIFADRACDDTVSLEPFVGRPVADVVSSPPRCAHTNRVRLCQLVENAIA